MNIDSEQDRLRSIYIQLGIPGSQIIIDQQQPGGGTVGEIKRIRTMMLEHRFHSALIVTSWWHTRRTKTICQHAFENTNIEVRVV